VLTWAPLLRRDVELLRVVLVANFFADFERQPSSDLLSGMKLALHGKCYKKKEF